MTRRASAATATTVLLLTAGVLAAGCGTDTVEVATEEGPTLLVAPPADGGMDALVVGELVVNDAGCVALAGRGGDQHVLLAPDGSTLLDGGTAVDLPGLGTVGIGEQLEAGGGYQDRADVDEQYADCLGPGDAGMVVLSPLG